MEVVRLDIPDVMLLRPVRRGDPRGYFTEHHNAAAFAAAGVTQTFVQDNISYSARKGTVRGLHFQTPPHAQAKLVSVLTGRIRDVAVDVRIGSPTYGRHVSADLSEDEGWQILAPQGFLHGFATLTDDTRVLYKVSDGYAPECDSAVLWNDGDLGIDWGIDMDQAILSDKDKVAQPFAALKSPFRFGA